jgi:hypothetical protein
MNRTFDLGAAAPRLILRVVGGGLRRTVMRRHRGLARQAADARFPGQLRIVGERSLFPQSIDSEFTFAFAGDRDAVVRLRVEQGSDVGAALDLAVDAARTAATELRRQLTVFAAHGFPVIGLDRRPWVAVELTDENVDERLRAIGAAVADWAAGTAVVITSPGVAARAPDHDNLPTPLRLGHPGRMRVLTAAPAFVATYRDGEPTLTVSRSHEPRTLFEEGVLASATTWLHRTRPKAPEAAALQVFGRWTLLPGQVTRSAGVVLFADHRAHRLRPDHALAVVVDQNGNLVDTPIVHEQIRDDRGVVHLPT